MKMEAIETKEKKLEEELKSAGCHYGRAKRFTHSSMKQFLLKKNKSNIEFFNLTKTIEGLNQAINFLAELLKGGKIILFVGAKPACEKSIRKIAQEFNMPYVDYKWLGGFLTNFGTIKTRIEYFKELLRKEESGEIENYPPKEKNRIMRELEKMKKIYTGVIHLERLPDALFIVDLNYPSHQTAKAEANKKEIPIVAICGSDNNINGVKVVIPANDKAPSSIDYLINYLIAGIKEKLQENG